MKAQLAEQSHFAEEQGVALALENQKLRETLLEQVEELKKTHVQQLDSQRADHEKALGQLRRRHQVDAMGLYRDLCRYRYRYVCIHTDMCAYIHTYLCTCIHTYIHTGRPREGARAAAPAAPGGCDGFV